MSARHRALVLTALTGLAFAQPMLGGLDEEFLVAHRMDRLQAIVLILVVVVLPPFVLFVVEQGLGRVRPALLGPVHLGLVWLLSAVAIGQLLIDRTGWVPRTAAGVVVGVVVAAAYARFEPVRSFAAALVVAPLLAIVLFASGPGSEALFPDDAAATPVRSAARADAPVVLIIFDEFPGSALVGPDGKIDAGLFPNFARLARRSTWFPNATTVHNETRYAVPAIVTGRASKAGTHATHRDHPESIYTLLAGRYSEDVSEPYTQVCPRSVCSAAPIGQRRGLAANVGSFAAQRYLPRRLADRFAPIEQWRWQDDPAGQVAEFTRGFTAGRKPGLHVLHLVLPHRPYRYLPDGREYARDFAAGEGARPGGRLVRDRWQVTQSYQRFQVQLQFADRLLGRVIDRMQATGTWDRSAVAAVADHGVAIRPGDASRTSPDASNTPDILSVPLLIKRPGQRTASVSPRFARTVDVLPTVADAIGVAIPWRVDGGSLLTPRPDPATLTLDAGGPRVTVGTRSFAARNRAEVTPRAAVLAARRRGGDIFAVGTVPRLLGRPLDAAPSAGRASVSLAQPSTIAPGRQSEVYSRIGGRLFGVRPGTNLAVAVSGRIVATTRSFSDANGGVSFTAMVAPAVLRRGGRISVGVTQSGAVARLRPR